MTRRKLIYKKLTRIIDDLQLKDHDTQKGTQWHVVAIAACRCKSPGTIGQCSCHSPIAVDVRHAQNAPATTEISNSNDNTTERTREFAESKMNKEGAKH